MADDAGHDFSFAVDGLDLVAQGAKAAARHGVERLPGGVGHAEWPQVGVRAGPEFPFQFGKNVAGVGERQGGRTGRSRRQCGLDGRG